MNCKSAGAVAIGLFAVAMPASATTVDLTTLESGEINGAIFNRDDFATAGTGVIEPIVRIDAAGTQATSQGYNTSARPVAYDENTDPNFTRDITLGEIPRVDIGGTLYLQFFLDINEPRGADQEFLSLDLVNIYTNPSNFSDGNNPSDHTMLGTLRYEMSTMLGENQVLLDFTFNPGSGAGDMEMLVPLSNFAGAADSDYLFLYSHFGDFMFPEFAEEDGFEEWKIDTRTDTPPPPVIPLPSAAGMGLLGLGGVMMTRRRRA
jgi:MYXO-CTERM domain-containing protein